ncbi:MAG TPA: hypothetical protein VE715_11755, partial [Blastocatellia bacterium]|nr:hypothetical protein [Blastocatellia bacterium]
TWPSGTANNGAAAATVRLSAAQSEQDRPDGFKAIIECRKTYDFDATGAEIFENYGYSANPARVAADRILALFETRYRNNPTLARAKFRARVHWPSWVAWRDFCDQLIPWDRDGNGVNVFIRRFEANIGFTTDLSLAAALDQLTGLSATIWQDTGRQLVFLLPVGRQPVHHFHVGNIVNRTLKHSVIDLRKLTNRIIGSCRDTDDDFLGLVNLEPPDNTFQHALRLESIAKVGEIRSEREFSAMTQSQLSRIVEYWLRLGHDNPERYRLVGTAAAMHLLKGDFATISHPVIEGEYKLCLVLGITVRSNEAAADEVGVTLQPLAGPLYDDAAHRPRQGALTL